ncbi:MAG: SDR family oxidoreductase [Tepidiformaceae bacterium]
MADPLAGRVAAILCTGTAVDRAIAMALAGAGADIALGTFAAQQEFAVASIANEVWAVGREQFSRVLEASDPAALAAFAAETVDRLGRCDLLVVSSGAAPAPSPEETSAEEWGGSVFMGLTIPFLAVHAYQPVIERDGGGWVALVGGEGQGLVESVTRAGRNELAVRLSEAWAARAVRVVSLDSSRAAAEILRIAERA